MGESSDMADRQQLVDAVHRDAIRTDPSNPFFAVYRQQEASYISQHYHPSNDEDDNIQKLINIIVIYTLEHDDISYTQGMTDILSPILCVMKHEADAYICFAAMVERIKRHFEQWCTGTLHKLDRLRHLCEVLDPKLYQCLTADSEEDRFILFFGMVLIECRREFSFNDSFHLLETIWAGVACIKNSLPSSCHKSEAEWARYMTYESPEVLQQVFEGSGVPYSAVPLRHTISGSYSTTGGFYPYSRNPSLLSQSPPATAAFLRRSELETAGGIPELPDSSSSPSETPLGINHSDSSEAPLGINHSDSSETPLGINHSNSSFDARHKRIVVYGDNNRPKVKSADVPRLRSQSDSNLRSMSSQNTLTVERSSPTKSVSPQASTQKGDAESVFTHKLGNSSFSHSESELYDSFSNSKIVVQPRLGRHPTEMSDMSSLSSGTASGNLISSMKSVDSRRSGGGGGGGGARIDTPESRHSPSSVSATREQPHPQSGSTAGNNKQSLSSSECESARGSSGRGTRNSPGSDSAASSQSSDFKDAVDYQPHPSDVARSVPGDSHTSHVDEVLANTVIANHLPLDEEGCVVSKTQEVTMTEAAPTDEANMSTGACHVTRQVVDGGDADSLLQEEVEVQVEVVEHGGRITTNAGYKSPLTPQRASNSSSIRSTPRASPHRLRNGHPVSDGVMVVRRKRISSPKHIHHRSRTPPNHSNASTPVHYGSSSHRVTPVAFFDTMDKLAESGPGKGSLFPSHFTSRQKVNAERELEKRSGDERDDNSDTEEEAPPTYLQVDRQRANSDAEIGLLLSQLVSTEQGAPRVNTRDSLSIPLSNCYSLFVCLSILVQNRDDIIGSGADFYQLSTILNTQAARQDLDKTLKVSHQLYRIYRRYQEMWFGASTGEGGCYDRWLDDTAAGGDQV